MKGANSIPTPVEPDEESFRNAEHDNPTATAARKYQLMQADTLLRLVGWVRGKDGAYHKPKPGVHALNRQ